MLACKLGLYLLYKAVTREILEREGVPYTRREVLQAYRLLSILGYLGYYYTSL
ncbi:hypothetical protein L209DRAFT_755546 [Thermothelomyces heterothallicus CBS 203.75]